MNTKSLILACAALLAAGFVTAHAAVDNANISTPTSTPTPTATSTTVDQGAVYETVSACTGNKEGDKCDFSQSGVKKPGICQMNAGGKLSCTEKH